MIKSRDEQFRILFPNEPAFRIKQIRSAAFNFKANGWEDVTNLSKEIRDKASKQIPWMSLKEVKILESADKGASKALLETEDGLHLETVLMKNKRGEWTICVSSQIGCPVGCSFCATGAMGFKRNLIADEIIDQYRFWAYFLKGERISNIVFMGMGEPMLNYGNVKESINTILEFTDLGPIKITVSTSGVLEQMDDLLQDDDWPPVRIAISLHAPNEKERKKLIKKTPANFYRRLLNWSKEYSRLSSRRQHLTFEYLLIDGVNDSPAAARELVNFILKTGLNKINLIPYNPVAGSEFSRSQKEKILAFKNIISNRGIDITERRSLGEDIEAACGQLAG
jgi:23S rRNA (adenine2503-C2)-methyltransferase